MGIIPYFSLQRQSIVHMMAVAVDLTSGNQDRRQACLILTHSVAGIGTTTPIMTAVVVSDMPSVKNASSKHSK